MWEATFAPVIKLLKEYAGPFALHTAWEEMERCLNYTAELVEIPGGSLQDWVNCIMLCLSTFMSLLIALVRQRLSRKTIQGLIGLEEKNV